MRAPKEIIETAVAQLKSESALTKYQLEKFANTTAEHVKRDVLQIQNDREHDKCLMDFSRLESFIMAFEQFDEVCQSMEMGDPEELSSFIWGPPRFILQVRIRLRPRAVYAHASLTTVRI